METEPAPEDQTHKKGRHRKKQLYNSILQQMEFYFSDSNLTKDRFLSQLLQSDPYVDVSLFLKFNKIRKLTTSVKEITKAVGKSELIQLSEDKTKVCRKAPIQVKENVDACTIYVERLKSDATHDWLTSIFSEFGNVVYVSIPKYKHNGIIKGFAFIEFENEEGAKAALQYFESIDCKIPSFMEPHKLCSIATYEGDGKTVATDQNKRNKENMDVDGNEDETQSCKSKVKSTDIAEKLVDNEEKLSEDEQNVKNMKKRKCMEEKHGETHSKRPKIENETTEEIEDGDHKKEQREDSETGETTAIKKEKLKRKHDETETNGESNGQERPIKDKKQKLKDEDQINESVEQEIFSEAESEEKKKKKHKKSHRKKINLKEMGLQILSKKDWKRMRNRYLDMQKKTMKELKMHLNRQRFANRYETNKKPRPTVTETSQESENSKTQFVPGTIVKISLTQPCEDNKKLKNEIKTCSAEVKFVDIPMPVGSEEVYVRFSDNKNAQNFCDSNFHKGKMFILNGDEEKCYWEKIEVCKQAKQKHNLTKQRGRDKLLKKAEKQVAKHVHFDDSE